MLSVLVVLAFWLLLSMAASRQSSLLWVGHWSHSPSCPWATRQAPTPRHPHITAIHVKRSRGQYCRHSLQAVPEHVAFILDGNGRWAEQRGLPRSRGHLEGAKRALELLDHCKARGISMVTYYCLSTENWHRPPLEVSFILECVEETLRVYLPEARKKGVRVLVIGQRERLPPSLQLLVAEIERATQGNKGLTVCLALSYGGQNEIVEAAKILCQKVLKGEVAVGDIDESLFAANLPSTTQGLSRPPDLVIRTSGESRLSNFLLYQVAYSEFHVCSTLWPDFTREHLDTALQAFASRERRFGTIPSPTPEPPPPPPPSDQKEAHKSNVDLL